MGNAMDYIDSVLNKNIGIEQRRFKLDQTWEAFERWMNKKIILFGVGRGADLVLQRYPQIKIERIVDNDKNKKGFYLDDFVTDFLKIYNCGLFVEDSKMLMQYNPEEVAIVICSLKYYGDISDQLLAMGFNNLFSAFLMEVNSRKEGNASFLLDRSQYTYDYYNKYEINNNKIVIDMFNTYSDHGKYIAEELIKQTGKLDIVIVANSSEINIPGGVRVVKVGSLKYLYELATAHIWITNYTFPMNVEKRDGQICIETKHWASVTLKRFYFDSSTIIEDNPNVQVWKHTSQMLDYIITGSKFDTESCRRGFAFDGKIIEIGSCRSDAMFKETELKQKIYRYYKIPSNSHLLLFAPTYRYKKGENQYIQETREIDIDYCQLSNTLKKKFGGEWYIMLRLHPGHAKEVSQLKLPEFVINGSEYEDGQELCSACDVLISDYSSIMFEPAFVRKPVFLFATDRREYIDKEYDLLIDYDTLPFPIAETNEELAENIMKFEQKEYEQKVDSFLDKYGVHEDGHASERAAEFILKLIGE